MKRAKLIDKWYSALPPEERSTVRALVGLAARRRLLLYLVGGPVRDLLLGRPSLDVDLTAGGDALAFAREAAQGLGLQLVQHAPFLTSTLRMPERPGKRRPGFRLDIATARGETYARPGALPAVYRASIREDLLRRDFTINALALALTGDDEGELLDPAGGVADVEAGLVRVLHDNSFVDDATRVLRAVRYEARFGFRIEPHTEQLLGSHLSCLDTISGARIHHEVSRILAEAEPERALLRLAALGALRRLHPALSFDEHVARAFQALRRTDPHSVPAAYWPLLAWHAPAEAVPAIARRLALTRAQAEAFAAMPALRKMEAALASPSLAPATVAEILAAHPLASVRALAAATGGGTVRGRCLEFLERTRHVRTDLDGHDVIALGVKPGPEVGRVLRRLRVAKLNGEIRSRKDEEAMVRALVREHVQ